MQKKIFLIIFSVILSLVLVSNGILFFVTESFSSNEVFWLLSFILIEFCLIILGSALVARLLSCILLKPLHTINFENLENFPYPELKSLIEKIKTQNKALTTQFKHLKRKKQELQSLTQNMNDGLIFLSRSGKILSQNVSAEKYFVNLKKIVNILELDNAQFLKLLLKTLKISKNTNKIFR